jgi:two-component system OmpR family response regulator
MAAGSLERIMMVEDEPDIQTIARLALETVGGFTVEICGSGMEALEVAPTWQPDLILLDVMMPEMDGPTTFQKLKALPGTSMVPVVFMTAKVQPKEIESYKALGAIDVVAKPFDPMTLAETIKSIWTHRS